MSLFGTSRRASALAGIALGIVAGVFGCSSSETGSAPAEPGSQAGNQTTTSTSEADGTCTTNADCKTSGTTCASGVCQMSQCTGTYLSNPPLGQTGYAWLDRELVALTSGSMTLDAYNGTSNGSITPDSTIGAITAASSTPVDIAGGNFNASRPEGIAYVDGTNRLTVVPGSGTPSMIDLGFAGTFVAGGDTDGDGVDEILVTDGASHYAVCSAVKGSCTAGTVTLPGAPVDVAVGDLDGDGKAELLFAIASTIFAIPGSGTPVSWNTTNPLSYITAGDLDGDGRAELVGKYQGGSVLLDSKDSLYVYDLVNSNLTQSASLELTFDHSLDIAFWTFDQTPTIAVIPKDGFFGSTSSVQLYTLSSGTIIPGLLGSLQSLGAQRLASADVDGDSAVVSLMAGPKLLAGPVVPIAVLTAPPYSASHSTNPATASIGNSMQTGTGMSSGMSTSMSLSLSVGINFNLPYSVGFGAYIGESYAKTMSRETSQQTSITTSVSQNFTPNPDADGYYSGHVVIGGGCFHQYDYMLDDPTSHFGSGTGGSFTMFHPVGADQQTFTTRQYAAIVTATGNKLPTITIPYKLGDVSSYPAVPQTLEGAAIPAEDNVFTNPPSVAVGSSSSGSFSLAISNDTTNTQSTSTTYGTNVMGNASLGAFVSVQVQASADKSYTLDSSYSLTLGSTTTFGGDAYPIRQDSGQSEDDGALYGYTFTPYVYREHFTPSDLASTDGGTSSNPGYYVLTYAVTQRGSGQ